MARVDVVQPSSVRSGILRMAYPDSPVISELLDSQPQLDENGQFEVPHGVGIRAEWGGKISCRSLLVGRKGEMTWIS